MCGFLFTNKKVEDISYVNEFLKFRGPDSTNKVNNNGYTFVHNLLSITGEFTTQPMIDNDIVCLFNGEIYNYKDCGDEWDNDSEILIPLYKEMGVNFIKYLDGEFALTLIDFKKQILIVSTDTFSTKPLWMSINGDKVGTSSYRSCLDRLNFQNVTKLPANTTNIYSLEDMKLLETFTPFTFDINQHKKTYDDWIIAFEESIRKRSQGVRENIFLGLSSGYDSGAISNELNKQNVSFNAYTIMSEENFNIIDKRSELVKNHNKIYLKSTEYDSAKNYLSKNCEDFIYDGYDIKGDKASNGLSHICKLAIQDGCKIYMSGQGADEILSDYGHNGRKIYNHSGFGGLFPSSLNNFFPWHSFYDGTQIKYLNKEEYVASSYGIETRYPFLDKFLVQEFLWLDYSLKNKQYKAPLTEYLNRNNFPFDSGVKIGFRADSNLK